MGLALVWQTSGLRLTSWSGLALKQPAGCKEKHFPTGNTNPNRYDFVGDGFRKTRSGFAEVRNEFWLADRWVNSMSVLSS